MALTWVRTHDWDVERGAPARPVCDSDPDVFFPIGSSGPALEQIETARRICTACTVNEECLEFALATNQEAGIWGGTTEEERRKLRKVWLAKQRMVGCASRLTLALRPSRSSGGGRRCSGTVRCTRVPPIARAARSCHPARW